MLRKVGIQSSECFVNGRVQLYCAGIEFGEWLVKKMCSDWVRLG